MAAVKKSIEYGNQSISALKGADRVRKRPAVIFGSDGLEGCEHSVFEILSNAVDEAREGYGNVINITAYNDKSIKIDDHGRGVPLGYNEREGKYNWELIYCELYAGGKYNNNAAASAYKYSLGLNGLGACSTQYASEFMTVQSFDGTNMSKIEFARGNPVGELVVTPLEKRDKRTGTIVHWRPDLEVFTDINIPKEYYLEMLRKQSVVNSVTKFVFNWQVPDNKFETHEFYYERGIIDYVTELAGESALTVPVFWNMETSGHDRADKDDYNLKAEVSFCVSNTVNVIEYYHNASFLEHGGSPDKAVRSAFVHEIDKYLKNNNKYLKNESKISFNDVEDCLVLITSSFSTQTSYANQTKKAINNVFITEAMTEFLKHNLEVYFAENPLEAERFNNQVLINKRSREQAESTRLNLKKKLTGNIDIANRVEKFVNCRSKDPTKRELYIVEGDSALSSCKLGRDAEFQAIIPVRGKTLNCLKSTYDSILKKEIIISLLKVIGCGVELKTKVKSDMAEFDYESLRWDKIIICTDGDKDGYHIRTLILTMFYRLLPTLIKKGKIYIAESPLYEITAKDKTYFAYDEAERATIIKKIGNVKYTVQRSKGLGENEPGMMWQTTMNPETRRLIKIMEADETETYNMFDTMLGDNLPARKEYITLYGNNFLDIADVYGDD
ncbi:MAG: toprim domain-containing protein [Oscillospiraceae bacterium]|nr:toprim domain-containing protein [Oscillospiraceae bacterium]